MLSLVQLLAYLFLNYCLGAVLVQEDEPKNKLSFCAGIRNLLFGFSVSFLALHLFSFVFQETSKSLIAYFLLVIIAIFKYRSKIKSFSVDFFDWIAVGFSLLIALGLSLRDYRFGNPDNFHMYYTASLAENSFYPPIYPAGHDLDMSHYHYGVDLIGSIIKVLTKTTVWEAHTLQIFICVFFSLLALYVLVKNYQAKSSWAFFITVFVCFYTSINSLDFFIREYKNIFLINWQEFLARWLVMSWTSVSHMTSQLRLPAQNSALIFCFLLIILVHDCINKENKKPNFIYFISVAFGIYFCFPAFYYPICGAIFLYFVMESIKSYQAVKSKNFLRNSASKFSLKDSLKNEVLRRNPPNKNFKEPLPEPRFSLGSGLKNRRSRIFQWILNILNQKSKNLFLILVYCYIGKFLTFTSDPANLNGVKTLIISPSLGWYHWGKAYLTYFYQPSQIINLKQGFDYVYSSSYPHIPLISSITFREFGFCGIVGVLCLSYRIIKKRFDYSEIFLLSGLLSMLVPLLFEFLPRPIETTRFLHWTKIAFVIYIGLNLPLIYESSKNIFQNFIKVFWGQKLLQAIFIVVLMLLLIPGIVSVIPVRNFLIVNDCSLKEDHKKLIIELQKIHKSGEICLENIEMSHGNYLSELAGFFGVGGQIYKGDRLTRQTAIYLLNPKILQALKVDYLGLGRTESISSVGLSRLKDTKLFQRIMEISGTQERFIVYKFIAKDMVFDKDLENQLSAEYSWIIACDLANKLNPVLNDLGDVVKFNDYQDAINSVKIFREKIKLSNPICAFWLKEQALSNEPSVEN